MEVSGKEVTSPCGTSLHYRHYNYSHETICLHKNQSQHVFLLISKDFFCTCFQINIFLLICKLHTFVVPNQLWKYILHSFSWWHWTLIWSGISTCYTIPYTDKWSKLSASYFVLKNFPIKGDTSVYVSSLLTQFQFSFRENESRLIPELYLYSLGGVACIHIDIFSFISEMKTASYKLSWILYFLSNEKRALWLRKVTKNTPTVFVYLCTSQAAEKKIKAER